MSGKRILVLIAAVLSAAVIASCLTFCKDSQPDRLQLVGIDQAESSASAKMSLVVVTHGWIEKGRGGWPQDMAVEISKRADTNYWFCGYFDWSDGAKTLNATSAAEYARDITGPKLAEEIIKLDSNLKHIHLIGHSSGCWAVSEAAKILAQKTKADIHLTFFDAYISVFWDEASLADVNTAAGVEFWADHYYTRDYTLGWTQKDLTYAHNVDVTSIDQGLKDHNFPWRWYYATISGEYPKGHFLDNRKLVLTAAGIEYGFARSAEAGEPDSFSESLKLPRGNKAVEFEKQ